MEKLIDISSYPVVNVLDLLLQDKSTKKNIIWATDTYEELGEGFTDKVQINADALLQRPDLIRPRIQKSQEAQAQRTRKKAQTAPLLQILGIRIMKRFSARSPATCLSAM